MSRKEPGNEAFIHRYHAEVDADRGSDQRPYLVGQDRLEAGSLERYLVCRTSDSNKRANSRNTAPW